MFIICGLIGVRNHMWSSPNCDDSATLAPGTFMLTHNGRHASKLFSCEYSEQTHITLIGPINDRWQSAEPGDHDVFVFIQL